MTGGTGAALFEEGATAQPKPKLNQQVAKNKDNNSGVQRVLYPDTTMGVLCRLLLRDLYSGDRRR